MLIAKPIMSPLFRILCKFSQFNSASFKSVFKLTKMMYPNLDLIASPLPTIGLLLPIHFPQQHKPFGNEAEPLLRFSFAKFLANPCGLNYNGVNASPAVVDGNNQVSGSPLNDAGDLNGTASLPPLPQDLSKEALQLLDAVRHQYNVNRSPFSSEELVVTIDEFFLILQEVKDHINVMNPMVCLLIH